MKPISLFIISMLLFTGPAVCAAEDVRYYDIEVIVFESLDENAKISENWPTAVELETPATAVELGQPFPGPLPKEFDPKQAFKVTPSNQLLLLEEAKLLKESRNYRVLLHTGWRQPGMDVNTALPVHINQTYVVDELSKTPVLSPGPISTATTTQSQSRLILNGYIKVILSRYLHMDVKLAYTTNIPQATQTVIPAKQLDDPEAVPLSLPKPVVYFLNETRKMRSKEVHYLDSPVLGAVLLATPVEASR